MGRKKTLVVVLVVILAVAAGVVGWSLQSASPPATADTEVLPGAADVGATASNGMAGAGGAMPETASQVRIQAWFPGPVAADGTRSLSVRLHIADGWHVNANPASLDFLIPTAVKAEADKQPLALQTSYPAGIKSDVRLGDTDIKVYENDTVIRSELSAAAVAAAADAGGLRVLVTAQACSDKGICLPPSVMKTHLPASSG